MSDENKYLHPKQTSIKDAPFITDENSKQEDTISSTDVSVSEQSKEQKESRDSKVSVDVDVEEHIFFSIGKAIVLSVGKLVGISIFITVLFLIFSDLQKKKTQPGHLEDPKYTPSKLELNAYDLQEDLKQAEKVRNTLENKEAGNKVYTNAQGMDQEGRGHTPLSPPEANYELRVIRFRPEFKIPPGLTATARLNLTATNGIVSAQTTKDLIVDGEVMVPRGSVLLGTGTTQDERLMVHFTHVSIDETTTNKINAHAVDVSDNKIGLKGSCLDKTKVKLLKSMALSGLGALGKYAFEGDTPESQTSRILIPENGSFREYQDSHSDSNNSTSKSETSFLGKVIASIGDSILKRGQEAINNIKENDTVVEVPKETDFLIIFGENK